jgi:hypothetical protein
VIQAIGIDHGATDAHVGIVDEPLIFSRLVPMDA